MLVTLTHLRGMTPILVNLDRMLYAYRDPQAEGTVIVFGKVPDTRAGGSGALRNVSVHVTETLQDIQKKRRMTG